MFGLGTIINTFLIIAGGFAGHFCGKLIKPSHQEALTTACGVSTLFIAISGAMEGMLSIESGALSSGMAMPVVICVALGSLIGEILGLDSLLTRFGEWLKRKSGNASDARFTDGFVTASLTVCIGAMAIVGSIKDAIEGDISILCTKGILDFVIVCVLTCSMGKGCAFSAVPVFLIQGSMTLLAVLIKPLMTESALLYLSVIGSVLIFCVGVNLVWDRKIRVANMLPALILAVIAAYI